MKKLLIAILIIILVGAGGYYYWHNHQTKSTTKNPTQNTESNNANSYAGWNTYHDQGYSEASGINIKYPSDWQVKVGNNKAFAWVITGNSSPKASIGVRIVYLNSSKSAREEWDNCPSADACGPTPDELKVEDSDYLVNDLDVYSVTMKSNTGIRHATVIKSDKTLNDNTSAFVEFLLDSDDTSLLKIYNQIVRSASYPN